MEFNHRPLGPRAQALPRFVIWVHQCEDSQKSCPPMTQLTFVYLCHWISLSYLEQRYDQSLPHPAAGARGWFSVCGRE